MRRIILIGLLAATAAAQVITVPTSSELHLFPAEYRHKLELFMNTSLEQALELRYFVPGQKIDLDNEFIKFVVALNTWVKKHNDNAGLARAKDFLDAGEVFKRNEAEDAWEALCLRREAEFAQWRKAKKAGDKLFRR